MARKIPTIKLGMVIGMTDEAFEQLKTAFADLDLEAKARGMAVPVPA